jgi:hypothetical protein
MLTEIEFDKLQKERAKDNDTDKVRSVFASFKSYNKKNGNNVAKKYYIITAQANRFKYKGKLKDYKKTTGEHVTTKGINISYSDFKRLQNIKAD